LASRRDKDKNNAYIRHLPPGQVKSFILCDLDTLNDHGEAGASGVSPAILTVLAPGIGHQTNIINSSPTHQAQVQCLEQNPHIGFTNEMPE
jgi:hypothetical protein